MPFTRDTELDLNIRSTDKYIISSQHRRSGNPNKSIWTITNEEEVACFILSVNSNWTSNHIGWGIKLIGSVLQVVGRNDANADLKFAKFVDGTKRKVWHGWPADYRRKKQDIPSTIVLALWKNKNYISKSQVRKIKQQITCNL
jgi:hypothetical protein